MVRFQTIIYKFKDKGEKTGWTYIEVPAEIASQLLPGNKKSFRVRGKLHNYTFEGIALLPMGNGDFIMALNAGIRKKIKKQSGEKVEVQMEVDQKEKPLSEEFMICLEDEPAALEFFNTLPKGHQRYFSNWIETAKTEATKTKRIVQAIEALALKFGFGDMIRSHKAQKDNQF
ncbi:YdeI/OmpD-associated family protein [soil metagenome]